MHDIKFLLDADMPRSSVRIIRSLGFDAGDVRDIGTRRAKDKEIIEYALNNSRIIVTRDTDFGKYFDIPSIQGQLF
jgi:predicted nuclease of predicted toxin-antitoxin system